MTKKENFRGYVKLLVINFAVLISVLLVTTIVLDWQRLLVAPQFIASLSFDEKARFFKEIKPEQPQMIALGSSVTMNHLDSTLLTNLDNRPTKFVNFATYGLQLPEFKNLAQFSTRLLGKPDTLLVVSSPVDFTVCTPSEIEKAQFYVSFKDLKQDDVITYVRSNMPTSFYHAKYRTLWRMLDPKLIMQVRDLRNRRNTLESLQFDAGGSVLLNVSKDSVSANRWEGIGWGETIDKLEPSNACYQSLQDFAEYAKQEGMQLVFVNSPIRKAFLDRFDPQGERMAFHRKQLATILKNSGFTLLDAQQDLSTLSDEFYADAMHLNQNGAQRLTGYIRERLGKTV